MHLGQGKGAVLAKKGAPKLRFHREGGSCPHLPPESATATKLLTGNRKSDRIWIEVFLRLSIIFAHASIFLCVVKKSGRIGQNQEYCDKIKFGAHLTSKHDNCDRMHQVTLHYKRNLQNIQLVFLSLR